MSDKYLLGYVRKSVVEIDPDDHDAPEPIAFLRQKNAISRWAATHGYKVKFFEDIDISGRYEANRPGWQQLRAALDDGDVAGVIVEAFDRDHRNLREFLAFHDDELQPRSQSLISATQNIDVSTTDGRAMASVLMTFAEMESRKASDRMKDTITFQRERHGRYFGPPVFGCDRDEDGILRPTDKTYWLHPATGLASATEPPDSRDWEERYYHDSLAELFRIYGQGDLSYRATAEELNARGCRLVSHLNPDPQPYNADNVRETLRKWRLYGGELAVGKSQKDRHYIEGAHDPILPPELIQQAAAVFEDRARKPYNQKNKEFYLLSGLCFCAVCGRPLDGHRIAAGYRVARHRRGRGDCQECAARVDHLEEEIVAALAEIPLHPEIYSGIIDKIDMMIAAVFNSDEAEREAQLKLVELAGKLNRLQEIYVEGDIDRASYQSRKGIIEAEIAKVSQRARVDVPRNLRGVADEVIGNLGRIDGATPQTQKALIHSVVQRLDIAGGEIDKLAPTDWAKPFFFSLTAGVQGGGEYTHPHPAHLLKIAKWLK